MSRCPGCSNDIKAIIQYSPIYARCPHCSLEYYWKGYVMGLGDFGIFEMQDDTETYILKFVDPRDKESVIDI